MGEYLHVLELRLAKDGLNIDIEKTEKTEEEQQMKMKATKQEE